MDEHITTQKQNDESGETASMNKSAQDSGCYPFLELYIGPTVETEDVMTQRLFEIHNALKPEAEGGSPELSWAATSCG